MTKDEFNAALQAIGTCEDDVQRRGLIADLAESAGADYDAHAEAVASRDQLQADNEQLRAANMKLFLKVGDHKEPADKPGDEPKTKRSYKDLFNDKGGLK